MQRVINLLTPPEFEDPETNRVVKVLFPILAIILVASTILLFISIAIYEIPGAFVSIALADVVIVINMVLLGQGKITIPSYTSPLIFIIAITYNIYIGQGVHDITIIAYPISIILAGLFIGKSAAVFATLGSILGLSIIFWAEQLGVRVQDESYTFYAVSIDIWIMAVFLILTAALVYIAVGNLRDTLDQLRSRETELEQLTEELENRVANRTRELEKANKELESYSYSISHDLRAPLRAISGFSQIIQEDYSQDLPTDGQDFLTKVIDNSRHMNDLIDDLLAFSRLDKQTLKTRKIPADELKLMIKTIVDNLLLEEADRVVDFTINDLQTVEADPTLLRQVLANLISNAFKYSRPREAAEIEVGFAADSNPPVLFVKDNGVGFNLEYSNNLFGVFRRMHSADEFEGTGIGLATVARIVQRHGGRIWANAEVDKGATFFFTLGPE